MARYNAMEENFTEVRVLGKSALFHDLRIDRVPCQKDYIYMKCGMMTKVGDPCRLQRGSWSIILGLLLPVNPSDCHRTGIFRY